MRLNRPNPKPLPLLLLASLLALMTLGALCPKTLQPNPRYEDASLETKAQDLRNFFAQVLDPEPQDIAAKEIPVKAACRDHLGALWLVANDPEALQFTKLPIEIQELMVESTRGLQKLSESEIAKALQTLDRSEYEKMQASFDNALRAFKFEDMPAFKELANINLPDIGETWTLFLRAVLNGYFPSLQDIDKRRVLASMLRTKSTSSSTEVLLALIYGSGPFFQKYIQLLGDYLEPGNDPDLKALRENLKDVKSGLAHIKPYYLAKYTNEIEAQRGVRIHILKSLGAASVGETFLCTMQKRQSDGSFGPAQEVVVKFMRPDIEDVALREADFFQKTAGSISHMMGESFEGLKKQILDEMDYVKELDKLKRGYEVYNEPNSSIRVVRPIPDNAFPQTKYYMAMELALGKTFKDVRVKTLPSNSDQAFRAKVELMVKGVLLELLTNRYIDKAFFLTPDGFFHGDLHDGNILMIIDDKVFDILQKKVRQNGDFSREDVRKLLNVKGNNGQNLIKITLIDFGNAHSLTKKERSGMLNLFISCTPISQSIPAFMQAFDELSNLPIAADKIEIIKKDLEADAFNPEKAFEEVNGVKIKKRAHQRLGAAMDTLMANDIPIPASIMAFSRSLAMIDNSFKQLFEDVRMGQLKGFKDFNFNSSIEDIAIPQLAREFLLPDALAPESWQPDIGLSWENKKAIGKSSVDVIKYYLLNKNDTANNLE